MKRTASARITADICFYFSILCLIDSLQPCQTAMAVFTAAAFFAASFAVRTEILPLRLLLGLLPGAAFLLAPMTPLLLLPGLAWLYFLLIVTLGGFHEGLYEYRGRYRIMLIVGLFCIAGNLANIAIYRGRMLSPAGLIYLFLFMTLGVIALRQMQMGTVMDRRWQLSNAATVFLVPLLAIGIAFLLYELLRLSVPVWKTVLSPIANLIIWAVMALFGREEAAVLATPAPSATPPSRPNMVEQGFTNGNLEERGMEGTGILPRIFTEDVLTPLAYILAALLLFAALWFIWKLIRRAVGKEQNMDLYYEDTDLPGAPRRLLRRRSAGERSNARRVRRLYREYLALQRRLGSEIRRDSTSQDVLEQTAGEEADATLRRIYIAARYGGVIADEDVQTAERCLEEIRKQAKNGNKAG